MQRNIFNKSYFDYGLYPQIENVKKLVGQCLTGLAVMPDAHPGDNFPNGIVVETKSKFFKELVGSDIGCGITCFDFGPIPKNIDSVLDKIKVIDVQNCRPNNITGPYHEDLGTLGSGNHFAELCVIEETDHVLSGNLLLLVHCGSRKFGKYVAENVDDNVYLLNHQKAIRWAIRNREIIATMIYNVLKKFNIDVQCPKDIINITHNYIDTNVKNTFIHRKGAVSTAANEFDYNKLSTDKLVILPGSRGTNSYILSPIDNKEAQNFALNSVAHGAGRMYKRSKCKDIFNDYEHKKLDIVLENGNTSRVCCNNENLLIQEHPDAYKCVNNVLDDLKEFNLVKTVLTLRPIWTFKD